eukprot:gene5024-903_t
MWARLAMAMAHMRPPGLAPAVWPASGVPGVSATRYGDYPAVVDDFDGTLQGAWVFDENDPVSAPPKVVFSGGYKSQNNMLGLMTDGRKATQPSRSTVVWRPVLQSPRLALPCFCVLILLLTKCALCVQSHPVATCWWIATLPLQPTCSCVPNRIAWSAAALRHPLCSWCAQVEVLKDDTLTKDKWHAGLVLYSDLQDPMPILQWTTMGVNGGQGVLEYADPTSPPGTYTPCKDLNGVGILFNSNPTSVTLRVVCSVESAACDLFWTDMDVSGGSGWETVRSCAGNDAGQGEVGRIDWDPVKQTKIGVMAWNDDGHSNVVYANNFRMGAGVWGCAIGTADDLRLDMELGPNALAPGADASVDLNLQLGWQGEQYASNSASDFLWRDSSGKTAPSRDCVSASSSGGFVLGGTSILPMSTLKFDNTKGDMCTGGIARPAGDSSFTFAIQFFAPVQTATPAGPRTVFRIGGSPCGQAEFSLTITMPAGGLSGFVEFFGSSSKDPSCSSGKKAFDSEVLLLVFVRDKAANAGAGKTEMWSYGFLQDSAAANPYNKLDSDPKWTGPGCLELPKDPSYSIAGDICDPNAGASVNMMSVAWFSRALGVDEIKHISSAMAAASNQLLDFSPQEFELTASPVPIPLVHGPDSCPAHSDPPPSLHFAKQQLADGSFSSPPYASASQSQSGCTGIGCFEIPDSFAVSTCFYQDSSQWQVLFSAGGDGPNHDGIGLLMLQINNNDALVWGNKFEPGSLPTRDLLLSGPGAKLEPGSWHHLYVVINTRAGAGPGSYSESGQPYVSAQIDGKWFGWTFSASAEINRYPIMSESEFRMCPPSGTGDVFCDLFMRNFRLWAGEGDHNQISQDIDDCLCGHPGTTFVTPTDLPQPLTPTIPQPSPSHQPSPVTDPNTVYTAAPATPDPARIDLPNPITAPPTPVMSSLPCLTGTSVDMCRECAPVDQRTIIGHCVACNRPAQVDPLTHHCMLPSANKPDQGSMMWFSLMSGDGGSASVSFQFMQDPRACPGGQNDPQNTRVGAYPGLATPWPTPYNYSDGTVASAEEPDTELMKVVHTLQFYGGLTQLVFGAAVHWSTRNILGFVLFLALIELLHWVAIVAVTLLVRTKLDGGPADTGGDVDGNGCVSAAPKQPWFFYLCQILGWLAYPNLEHVVAHVSLPSIAFSSFWLMADPTASLFDTMVAVGGLIGVVGYLGFLWAFLMVFPEGTPNTWMVPYKASDPTFLVVENLHWSALPPLVNVAIDRLLPSHHWMDCTDDAKRIGFTRRWSFLFSAWKQRYHYFGALWLTITVLTHSFLSLHFASAVALIPQTNVFLYLVIITTAVYTIALLCLPARGLLKNLLNLVYYLVLLSSFVIGAVQQACGCGSACAVEIYYDYMPVVLYVLQVLLVVRICWVFCQCQEHVWLQVLVHVLKVAYIRSSGYKEGTMFRSTDGSAYEYSDIQPEDSTEMQALPVVASVGGQHHLKTSPSTVSFDNTLTQSQSPLTQCDSIRYEGLSMYTLGDQGGGMAGRYTFGSANSGPAGPTGMPGWRNLFLPLLFHHARYRGDPKLLSFQDIPSGSEILGMDKWVRRMTVVFEGGPKRPDRRGGVSDMTAEMLGAFAGI